MGTGYFNIVIVQKRITEASQVNTDTSDQCTSEVLLKFVLTGVEHKSFKTENGSESSSSSLNLKWNTEQIDDFVRKLGFIEDQDIEQPIKVFQQLNQVFKFI